MVEVRLDEGETRIVGPWSSGGAGFYLITDLDRDYMDRE